MKGAFYAGVGPVKGTWQGCFTFWVTARVGSLASAKLGQSMKFLILGVGVWVQNMSSWVVNRTGLVVGIVKGSACEYCGLRSPGGTQPPEKERCRGKEVESGYWSNRWKEPVHLKIDPCPLPLATWSTCSSDCVYWHIKHLVRTVFNEAHGCMPKASNCT